MIVILKPNFFYYCFNTLHLLDRRKKDSFVQKTQYDWDRISKIINSLWDLTTRFEQGKLPIIRLNNVKSSDAQTFLS